MKELMMCYFNAFLLQIEFVEGQELDHRIRSRINLVDLAGIKVPRPPLLLCTQVQNPMLSYCLPSKPWILSTFP